MWDLQWVGGEWEVDGSVPDLHFLKLQLLFQPLPCGHSHAGLALRTSAVVSQQHYSILSTNTHAGVANVFSRLDTPQLQLESFLARGSILPADNVPQLIQEGRQFQQTVPEASKKILGFMLKRISIKCLKNG